MQRLLAFIENNLHLILFVVLQIVCGFLVFSLNAFQQAAFTHSANTVTASVNKTVTNITDYLDLRQQNKELQYQLATQFNQSSSGSLFYLKDTFTIKDSIRRPLFSMVPAQVIYNTVNRADNVFIINKGSLDGIKKNMGVISSQGLAGIVLKTSSKYSTVMSLLNTNMKIIPSINGKEYFTELIWDNESPYFMKLQGVNKLEKIIEGDLITTGHSSLLFPKGVPIGTVSKLSSKPNSQYFQTRIKTATDFRSLEYVYVIVNQQKEALEAMLPANE